MPAVLAWFIANWTEILGFVTGAVCVFLAARRNIWNFPIGVANNIVFFVLFVGSALYADAGLQVVYLALGVMGWINWARHRADDHRAVILHTPRRAIPALVAATVIVAVILTVVLHRFTNSTTEVADASTTAVSLAAQYMLNRRWIENWFVWAAVDVVYIGLYLVKGLWITGTLYLLFIALCVSGYLTWRRSQRNASPIIRVAPEVTASV